MCGRQRRKGCIQLAQSILHGLGLDLHPVQKETESRHCAMNFKASPVTAERPNTLQRVSSCLVAKRKEHIYLPWKKNEALLLLQSYNFSCKAVSHRHATFISLSCLINISVSLKFSLSPGRGYNRVIFACLFNSRESSSTHSAALFPLILFRFTLTLETSASAGFPRDFHLHVLAFLPGRWGDGQSECCRSAQHLYQAEFYAFGFVLFFFLDCQVTTLQPKMMKSYQMVTAEVPTGSRPKEMGGISDLCMPLRNVPGLATFSPFSLINQRL